MAGIGESGLAMVLQKAQRLASPQFDNYKQQTNIESSNYCDVDQMVSGNYSVPSNYNMNENAFNNAPILNGQSKSKLPKEIMESFYENPIEVSGLDVGGLNGTSVLDSIMPQLTGTMPTKPQNSNMIKETRVPQQIISGGNSTIDYGVIKSLIDESVHRHLNEFKTVIKESKTASTAPSMNLMRIGNKFQFIDSKGNIFEAKLEFKGNIKDKK